MTAKTELPKQDPQQNQQNYSKPPAAPTKGYVALPNALDEFRYIDQRDGREKRLSIGEKEWIRHLMKHRDRREAEVFLRQATAAETAGQTDRSMRRYLNKPHMRVLVPRRIQRDRYGRPQYTLYDLSLVLAMLPAATLKSMGVYERVVQKLSARESTVDIAHELVKERREGASPSQKQQESPLETVNPNRTDCAGTSGTTDFMSVKQQSAGEDDLASPESEKQDAKVSPDGDDALFRLLTQRWPDGTTLRPEQARRAIRDLSAETVRQQVAWLPARRPTDFGACLYRSLFDPAGPWSEPTRLKRPAARRYERRDGGERVSERRGGAAADRADQPERPDPPAPPAAGAYQSYQRPASPVSPQSPVLPQGRLSDPEAIAALCTPEQYRELLAETVERLRHEDHLIATKVRKHAALTNPHPDLFQGKLDRTTVLNAMLTTAKERRKEGL